VRLRTHSTTDVLMSGLRPFRFDEGLKHLPGRAGRGRQNASSKVRRHREEGRAANDEVPPTLLTSPALR